MPFVLDASAALARIAPDETVPGPILAAMDQAAIVVPALWPFEIANGLWFMRRKARLDDSGLADAIEMMNSFAPEVDPHGAMHVWMTLVGMALQHGLTAYDAAYLELAQRRGLPLATLDGDMIKAAKRLKVKLV